MELEVEPRAKPLPYKVKAMSRESAAQKAANVLDPDLRTHWSTATNTKEWILLELDETCLLSHIRIYNKSVLEWEITVGLRYKPENFLKVRPRCEAPRRDMVYPMNYTPCRYVRISCLRGNPIAIFFIQLVGVTITGLEPEFQPIVNYLLPHIISHKQDAHDMHIQLLRDVAKRLLVLLPQLEADLNNFADSADINIRYFAMLAGPFYPILHLVNERKAGRMSNNSSDLDETKSPQSSTLNISSNFEAQPKRSQSPIPFSESTSSSIVFNFDAVMILLRMAYKDSHLGIICRRASRLLHRLTESALSLDESVPTGDLDSFQVIDEMLKSNQVNLADYSVLFGEEFMLPEEQWDSSYLNILDIAAVEEGLLHVLYGCASQPHLCSTLSDSSSDFWCILPLVQALLPALRPPINSTSVQVDESLSPWKYPPVQHALSQIITMSSSSVYHPLLRACAGYLSSFSSTHLKAACVLIDLCAGPLSPWISIVTAKVDLAIELLEDLLGIIQSARQSVIRARVALKCILLALSGHLDDVLAKYKEVKHRLLFLLEMLEPFLDPAIWGTIEDASTTFARKQESACAVTLAIIRTALGRPAILPSLESEWRRGSVAPSILLSVLGPHMALPPGIDLRKCSAPKDVDQEYPVSSSSSHLQGVSSIISNPDEAEERIDAQDGSSRKDVIEDVFLLFAPPELKATLLANTCSYYMGENITFESDNVISEERDANRKNSDSGFLVKNEFDADYLYLQADYLQLINHQESDFRASEFEHLAADLSSQPNITQEGHDAAIDALLLAAECYVNPFFMMSFRPKSKLINQLNTIESKFKKTSVSVELNKEDLKRKNIDIETIAHLEKRRDKAVLEILLHAAKMDLEFYTGTDNTEHYAHYLEGGEQVVEISPKDMESADAVTMIRNNQTLFCHFVIRQLLRGQEASHEILLHSLLFILHSATQLSCCPEIVIDIILESAENLNRQILYLYRQLKEGNQPLDYEKIHGVQRRWRILQKLVVVASGDDDGTDWRSNGFQCRSLVPPSSWMQKISKFASSTCPLRRFLGWMAVSRNAKQYLKEHLFLVSDLSQLSSLLTIFADELAVIDNMANQEVVATNLDSLDAEPYNRESGSSDQLHGQLSFQVLYPHLHMFFGSMKEQFKGFGEIILESVGLQLKCLPSSVVPDILCWFAELCLWPCLDTSKDHLSATKSIGSLRGYTARNAKAVVLYVLESIIVEHMEAMIPEMPRIANILMSLCRASYCDVTFLDSVLSLLGPLMSYFLRMVSEDEKLTDVSLQDSDLSSFEDLFDSIESGKGSNEVAERKKVQGSLLIFILGYMFPDLTFKRKNKILESLLAWVDFTASESTLSFFDYLSAFQKFISSCYTVLTKILRSFDIHFPLEEKQPIAEYTISSTISSNDSQDLPGFADSSSIIGVPKESEGNRISTVGATHSVQLDEIGIFLDHLDKLILGLIPAIEASWRLHFKLAINLVLTLSKCLFNSKCLNLVIQTNTVPQASDADDLRQSDLSALSTKCAAYALEGIVGAILAGQDNHCWQVASTMLDFLFSLPASISLDSVIARICLVIKNFCFHAPKISWRLQGDKWLSVLLSRGISHVSGNEGAIVDLIFAMLAHSEPEQRSVALHHLGKIVGLDSYGVTSLDSCTVNQSLIRSAQIVSIPESVTRNLVTKTWDKVASLALSDPSMLLRTHSMSVLLGYIPFAERTQLQSFFLATNTILRGMGKITHSMEEGHLTQLSLHLLASACIHSPDEDITLVPESVWKNIENMGMSRTGVVDDIEKKLCLSLRKLRTELDDGKRALKEVLSSSSAAKESDPNLRNVRESILQVLASLTSVQSYFDFFSKKADEHAQELEEAEVEMELLKKEKAVQKVSGSQIEETTGLSTISNDKDNSRLQQIKKDVRSMERSKIREEIIARRHKKLLMGRARQKRLEEAAFREMELLQELDRERTIEHECEIERQHELHLERAKTRELQFNLDMEKEKLTQKELQRELEQVESGVRSSRRDFSSSSSRPRERFRERENGRSGQEGSLRPSSRGRDGSLQISGAAAVDSSGTSTAPTVVLAGPRSFAGQLPTILQSRDHRTAADDRSTTPYEDNYEGSRDSGDANSIGGGDIELASSFEGSFGSSSRHGSRGSKPRQIVERREREGRREGKWERKHS